MYVGRKVSKTINLGDDEDLRGLQDRKFASSARLKKKKKKNQSSRINVEMNNFIISPVELS